MEPTYHLDQTFTHKTSTHEFHINWTRIGNPKAPTLIFIHGTPWSNVVWQPLAASLSTRYNIYLYDHPGFGTSPLPRRLENVEADELADLDGPLVLRAEASAALFKHWNLQSPPHVVAHDNGGLVSLRLLLQHSIEIASQCLIDVVALGPFGLPFFKLVAENQDVFAAVPPNMVEGLVRAYVRSAAYKPLPPGIEDLLSGPWLTGGSQEPAGFLREMRQGHYRASNIEDQYGSVGSKVPVKIIWGKDDAWIPSDTAQRLKEALNAEEAVLVEEAGHLIHYDQPSKLAIEVGFWLDKNGNGRSA